MTYLIFLILCVICNRLNIIGTESAFIGIAILGFLFWIVHCYVCVAPNLDKFISKSNKEQEDNNNADK